MEMKESKDIKIRKYDAYTINEFVRELVEARKEVPLALEEIAKNLEELNGKDIKEMSEEEKAEHKKAVSEKKAENKKVSAYLTKWEKEKERIKDTLNKKIEDWESKVKENEAKMEENDNAIKENEAKMENMDSETPEYAELVQANKEMKKRNSRLRGVLTRYDKKINDIKEIQGNLEIENVLEGLKPPREVKKEPAHKKNVKVTGKNLEEQLTGKHPKEPVKEPVQQSQQTTVKKEPAQQSQQTTVKKEPVQQPQQTTVKKEPAQQPQQTTVKKEPAQQPQQTTVKKEPVQQSQQTTVKKEPVQPTQSATGKIEPGKDPVLEKYFSEGFHQNAFGWYFNPWENEYDREYDPHTDKAYNSSLKQQDTKGKVEQTVSEKEESEEVNEYKQSEIEKIEVIPIEDVLRYYSDKEYKKDKEFNGLNYTDARRKYVIEALKEEMPDIEWDSVEDILDSHVIEAMVSMGGSKEQSHEQISKYYAILKGEEADLTINYDLRNIYKSNLSYKQIQNLQKMVKEAEKINPDAIKVDRDPFLKRFFGNISKRIEAIQLLGDGENEAVIEETDQEEIENVREEKKKIRFINRVKEVINQLTREDEEESVEAAEFEEIDEEEQNKTSLLGKVKETIKQTLKQLTREEEEDGIEVNESEEIDDGKESKKKTKLLDKIKARIPDHEKRSNIISKAKSIGKSKEMSIGMGIGKATRYVVTEARVLGARIAGQFKGERGVETDMKVQNIRKSFVQSLQPPQPIDHEAAQNAVAAQAERTPLEVAEYTIEEVKE